MESRNSINMKNTTIMIINMERKGKGKMSISIMITNMSTGNTAINIMTITFMKNIKIKKVVINMSMEKKRRNIATKDIITHTRMTITLIVQMNTLTMSFPMMLQLQTAMLKRKKSLVTTTTVSEVTTMITVMKT